ncbi:hypothetical protein [Castellaniella sp.]|uniref:hypothetical protein n=1 Tax=Castellaniella sp. TaxID=1955812 RepID=UPI002AFF460C|nr:hypothetical protein [Castellaniella sp.]
MKLLFWLGSSKKDLLALSPSVRKFFGHALDIAQRGEHHPSALEGRYDHRAGAAK